MPGICGEAGPRRCSKAIGQPGYLVTPWWASWSLEGSKAQGWFDRRRLGFWCCSEKPFAVTLAIWGASQNKGKATVSPGDASGQRCSVLHYEHHLLFHSLSRDAGSFGVVICLLGKWSAMKKNTTINKFNPLMQNHSTRSTANCRNSTIFYMKSLDTPPYFIWSQPCSSQVLKMGSLDISPTIWVQVWEIEPDIKKFTCVLPGTSADSILETVQRTSVVVENNLGG